MPRDEDRLSILFEPVRIGSLTVPNRIAMAAMGRLGSTEGVLGPNYAAYYRRRAEGGTGLIFSEATAIDDPMSEGYQKASHFHGGGLTAWRGVVEAVHSVGGLFAPQLWHAGIARSDDAPNAERGARSPSGLSYAEGATVPALAGYDRPMSDSDIADVIAAYARTARSAQDIGCDALQIHGAHGYLLDQFLWSATNRRADGYGPATVGERARISAEVVKAMRAAGVTIPITFRFSQWKMQDYGAKVFATPAELEEFLGLLADAGTDCFDVSTRRFWLPEFEGSDRSLAAWTKHLAGLPVIAVGSVGVRTSFTGEAAETGGNPEWPANLGLLIDALERGDFDMIALARALLANPAFANLLRERRFSEIREFEPDDGKVIA